MSFLSNPTIMIPAAAAIIAALLTVFLTRWHARSRPWVGLSSIQRDDRFLVHLPSEVVELLSKFIDLESRSVPLRVLLDTFDSISDSVPAIKSTIEVIDTFQSKAKNRDQIDLINLLEKKWGQVYV